MNSHQRRVVERRWPHCVAVTDPFLADECLEWLAKTYGNSGFTRKRIPRWCWRPDYETSGNFSQTESGVQLFFRRKADYAWFLLKWEQ